MASACCCLAADSRLPPFRRRCGNFRPRSALLPAWEQHVSEMSRIPCCSDAGLAHGCQPPWRSFIRQQGPAPSCGSRSRSPDRSLRMARCLPHDRRWTAVPRRASRSVAVATVVCRLGRVPPPKRSDGVDEGWTLRTVMRHHDSGPLPIFFTGVGMFAISVQVVAYLVEEGFRRCRRRRRGVSAVCCWSWEC